MPTPCTCDTFTGVVTSATGSTLTGTVYDRGGAALNVQNVDFGGDVQAAITAATAGDIIVLPRANYDPFDIDKKVALQGNAIGSGPAVADVDGSIISGTNDTIVRATVPFKLDSVCIKESETSGDADSIALNIDNGSGGVARWVLRDVYLTGTIERLGVGLHCYFALKGVVNGGNIEGWDNGVVLEHTSNANLFIGTKIRWNNTGVCAPVSASPVVENASTDDLFLLGCSIEGNKVGVKAMSGAITLQSCHLENTYIDDPHANPLVEIQGKNVVMGGTAALKSTGCDFGGAATDIEILSGNAQNHSSVGDTFRGTITHNGTGVLRIVNPTLGLPVITGTGPVILEYENVIHGVHCSGRDLKVEGFATVYSTEPGQGFTAHSPDNTRYRLAPPNGGGTASWVTV